MLNVLVSISVYNDYVARSLFYSYIVCFFLIVIGNRFVLVFQAIYIVQFGCLIDTD